MAKPVIVVTGAAGFIGSNLIKKLNATGTERIVAIDSLGKDNRWKNLRDLRFIDLVDYDVPLADLETALDDWEIEAFFHIGANADVLETDARKMFHQNFEISRLYLRLATKHRAPFLYASSSAVYGNSGHCVPEPEAESPHNAYALSKLAFDNHVRGMLPDLPMQVIGLRFFNVFGEGEWHKGKNASLPYRFTELLVRNGTIDLFDARIDRDYVSVTDLCEATLRCWKMKAPSGIYNLGSGTTISHADLAQAVASVVAESGLRNRMGAEPITKIPLPSNLKKHFQFFTKAESVDPIIQSAISPSLPQVKAYVQAILTSEQFQEGLDL